MNGVSRRAKLGIWWFVLGPLGLLLAVAGPLITVTAGTTEADAGRGEILRNVRLRLDASVHPDLAVDLRPLQRRLSLTPGRVTEVQYVIQNLSPEPVSARAIPSVLPSRYAHYLLRLDCFCTKGQILKPGERRELSVELELSPELPVPASDLALSFRLLPARPETRYASAPWRAGAWQSASAE